VLFTASVEHFFSPKVTDRKVKGKSGLLTFIIAGKSFGPLTFTVRKTLKPYGYEITVKFCGSLYKRNEFLNYSSEVLQKKLFFTN
jgi:hypothetical protein